MAALSVVEPDESVTDKPSAAIMSVDPATARRWLGFNTRNRNLKPTRIAEFVRDMRDGKWLLTGEPIKFGTDGVLLDGQNRLHAVIESGVTILTMVVRGIDPAAQEVMDTGTRRSAADSLRLRGYADAKDLAAAVGTYLAWEDGDYQHAMVQTGPKKTNREILESAARLPELRDTVLIARRIYKTLPLPIGALSTAYVVFRRIDPDDCEEFFSRIEGLRTEGTGDPINTLIRRVSDMRNRKTRVWASTGIFMLFRAWNAFRDGEKLRKFQFGSDDSGWAQMPDPK